VKFTEALDLNGSPSISFGDFEIANQDGSLDGWLSDVWANRRIQVFMGAVRWPRTEFRRVLDGVVQDIGSTRRETLLLHLSDKLQRLNIPVMETTLGGATQNANRLLPVALGEVFNVEPLLIDPTTLQYRLHTGSIERAIEVRDNGVPVSFTPALAGGTFALKQSPVGQITASVQGDSAAGYSNAVAALVQRLATQYGTATQRFGAADLDAANLNAFAAAHPQPVGLYLANKANVLQCCQELAGSVGAAVTVSTQGLLRLVALDLPAAGPPWVVTADDMELRSLSIAQRSAVVAAVKLRYCRNYTVQDQLQTGLPAASKDAFAQEWLTATVRDEAVAATYRLNVEPGEADTCLLAEADAQTEAQRRLNLWKMPRHVFRFTGYARLLLVELGDAMTLMHRRFNLAGGKTGLVVSVERDWLGGRVTIGVLI
jgi:hypothetical protein